ELGLPAASPVVRVSSQAAQKRTAEKPAQPQVPRIHRNVAPPAAIRRKHAGTVACEAARMSALPLIMHVVYRFSVGGLENGVVNLVNRLPGSEFRHVIVALTTCDEQFCRRIERNDVEFISLTNGSGHGFRLWPRMWRLFRRYRPAVVHSRTL